MILLIQPSRVPDQWIRLTPLFLTLLLNRSHNRTNVRGWKALCGNLSVWNLNLKWPNYSNKNELVFLWWIKYHSDNNNYLTSVWNCLVYEEYHPEKKLSMSVDVWLLNINFAPSKTRKNLRKLTTLLRSLRSVSGAHAISAFCKFTRLYISFLDPKITLLWLNCSNGIDISWNSDFRKSKETGL